MKQTILLTGATGFLGSRLLHKLLDTGLYHIVVLKRSSSNTIRIDDIIQPPNKIECIDIDTVGEDFWQDYFSKNAVDVIVHCATCYGRGSETPITRVLESNLMFPLSLLEAAVNHGLKLFINTDSYFNKPNQTYKTLLDYSLSKKTLNLWLEYLANKVKVANLRLEHIYGENDNPSKFVELMIRKIAVEKVGCIALTYGQQMRDFIYIDDVCDAYLAILDNYKKFAFHYITFEVGTGEKCSIRQFVENIKEISGSTTELQFGKLPYREDEIMTSLADTSFLNNLGWKSKTSVYSGIKTIIDFYQKNGLSVNVADSEKKVAKRVAKRQPIISLCIPSSGRVQFLERTLDSIYLQNTNIDLFEVCISDNSSDDNTKELLGTKYSGKKNIVYRKSSVHSYLNLIEALKLGNGKYLKLLNDYTAFSNAHILDYMISLVEKYENSNAVLFFNFKQRQESVIECENIEEFLTSVSYMNTSAPCFGIYKKAFNSITNAELTYNIWFPHVSLLYGQTNSKFVVINKKILSSMTIKRKGGYNLPMVFGKEYIAMNEGLLKNECITKATFDFLRLETLDFVADWYSMSKYDKKLCAFDFTDMKKWLSYYYTKDDMMRFYKMVKKYNKIRIVRKLF